MGTSASKAFDYAFIFVAGHTLQKAEVCLSPSGVFARSYLKPLNINGSWQFPVTNRVQK